MKYDNIYFIGIGGIGMSAIARFCKIKGAQVSGYDRTPSGLTRALEEEGIAVAADGSLAGEGDEHHRQNGDDEDSRQQNKEGVQQDADHAFVAFVGNHVLAPFPRISTARSRG